MNETIVADQTRSGSVPRSESRRKRQSDRTQTPTILNGHSIWGIDRIDQRGTTADSSCKQATIVTVNTPDRHQG